MRIMSAVDPTNKDPNYMANRPYTREGLIALANSLKFTGSLGPVPYARLRKTAEQLEYITNRLNECIEVDTEQRDKLKRIREITKGLDGYMHNQESEELWKELWEIVK